MQSEMLQSEQFLEGFAKTLQPKVVILFCGVVNLLWNSKILMKTCDCFYVLLRDSDTKRLLKNTKSSTDLTLNRCICLFIVCWQDFCFAVLFRPFFLVLIIGPTETVSVHLQFSSLRLYLHLIRKPNFLRINDTTTAYWVVCPQF